MTRVIGIDPGPVPGFVHLWVTDRQVTGIDVVQCTRQIAAGVLGMMLNPADDVVVQIERFVVGNRSARSSSAKSGETTRDLVGDLSSLATRLGARQLLQRSASEVKPWATDERLARVGLLEPTKAMRHARDAGRHAVFAAVHAGLIHDPLSKHFNRKDTPR